jgi:hypothetical protein
MPLSGALALVIGGSGKGQEMTETAVNLVFLGLFYFAVILCLLGPVAVIGFILWNWRKESIGLTRSH